jgi:hypothetical protein
MINILLLNVIGMFFCCFAISLKIIGDNIINNNSASLDSLNRAVKYYGYAVVLAFIAVGFSIFSIILCFTL